MAKQLRITQVRSASGRHHTQKGTVRALGLGRLGRTVTHDDNAVIRGMIRKISHLLAVVEVEESK